MLFIEKLWRNLARGDLSDVDIVLKFNEHDVIFPCHKSILSKEVPFFKKELSAHKNSNISIRNIHPYLIFLLLGYIYDKKFEEEDWKTIMDLCNLAIAYEITSLCEKCLRSLLNCLNLSNAPYLLELSMAHYPHPKLSILKVLNSLSLQLCVKGAFYIFDSVEFNDIQPTTVILIASQADLNVKNEAFVLYSLWIRATIDCCRNDMKLTYENVARYFEPFSKVIEYQDITEKEIRVYKNEFLMQYYNSVPKKPKRIYPNKRKMSFPLQLPLNFFDHYYTGDIISIDNSLDEFYMEFLILEAVYLIEFTVVCCNLPTQSDNGIESLWIENGKSVLFKWNKAEISNSNVKLKIQTQVAFTSNGEINFQMFNFVSHDLIKLEISAEYKLKARTSNKMSSWPEFNSKNVPDCPMQIKSNTHRSLKRMTFLKCPSVSGSE